MAQIEAQRLLWLAEKAGELCFVDLEATGLSGDYNSVLVVSIKPYRHRPEVRAVKHPGEDREVVEWAVRRLADFSVWVSYYGRSFDVPMLRTRLLEGGIVEDIPRRHHVDLYFLVRYRLNTSRRSQGHLLEWLYPEGKERAKVARKMTVSPRSWNDVLTPSRRDAAMRTLQRRCASDTEGLQSLYVRVRHLITEVSR